MTPIVLEAGDARVEIVRAGAELRVWRVGDAPLLWTPDPEIWEATAPILFPIVGRLCDGSVNVGGRRYPLGLHGFARTMEFDVLEQWPSHARLGLPSSAATRAAYPFDFALEVEYALDPASIRSSLTVRNMGPGPMPYACGLHPGFRWPFAGGEMEDYAITFGERELASVPIITADGFFTRQTRRVPADGRRLPLSPALMAQEALCFLDARSKSLRFAHRSGAAIEMALDDFPHIALWSRPAGRVLFIEAWTGHGDFVDADGDLFHKPSMRHLSAGAGATHTAKFSFVSPHLLFR